MNVLVGPSATQILNVVYGFQVNNCEYIALCLKSSLKPLDLQIFPNSYFFSAKEELEIASLKLLSRKKFDFILINTDSFVSFFSNMNEKFGVTHYIFTDDTYNDSAQKVEDLYNHVYSKLPFKITFTTYLRLDLLITYPHTAEILKDSGLKSAIFGIETLNAQSAKAIGKGMNPMKQIEFLQKHRDTYFSGINLTSGWIVGLPYETKQTVLQFAKWLPSNDNPLDSSFYGSLKVRPDDLMEFRLYRSEFDMNYSDYFNFYLNSKQETHWKSKITDLDSEWCDQVCQMITRFVSKTTKTKIGDFNVSDYVNIGVPIEELTKLTSVEIRNKYDIGLIYKDRHKKYLNNLLNL